MVLGKEKQSPAWPIPYGKKSPRSGSQKRKMSKETLQKINWFPRWSLYKILVHMYI
jgi:hypothetical protein